MSEEKPQHIKIFDWTADQKFEVVKVNMATGDVFFASKNWYDGKPMTAQEIEKLYYSVNN